jgi:hypothetical protein
LVGCARIGGHSAPSELEDEFPVGQLILLVGALDGICQLARVEIGVPT